MRKNLLSFFILICSLLAAYNSSAQQIASGTYAIPGTVTLTTSATIPVTTIGTAIDALNAYGVQSGGTVQFNFADGYTETATNTNGTGIGLYTIGGAGSALFSTSYTAVIFKHNGTGTDPQLMATTNAANKNSTSDYIVRILGADNITFDGIDFVENPANIITASSTASTTVAPMEYGVQILNSGTNGAQNNTIKNCVITLYNFLSATSTQSSVNTYGIYQLNNDATARNSGNVYDHVNITRSYRGIVINGMPSGSEDVGCVISNCKIGGSNAGDIGGASTTYGGTVDAIGVKVISQQDFTFYNDTVQNVQYARTGSSGVAYGVFLSLTTGTTTFNNNKIFNIINKRTGSSSASTTVGLEIEATSGTTNVYNNFIGDLQTSTSGTTTFMLFGIRIQGAGAINVYHNSIQLPNISGSGLCSSAALCTSDGSTGSSTFTGSINAEDNILSNASNITTGSAKAYCFYFGGGTIGTSNYNNFDIVPSGSKYYTGNYLGTTKQTLAAWQASAGDANSQQFTTAFASLTDLHLTISAPNALYNGIFIITPSITTDIDGETRVYPIIGADEPLFTTSQVRISNNNPSDSIVSKGSTQQVLAGVVLTALGTTNTLSSITFTTGGTYATASFINIKLVYNTTNTIVGATTLATAATPSSGGALAFTGLSQSLPLGANYVFVIFDVATTAVAGNNIRVTSTAFSNIVLAAGTTKVGTDPVPQGGLQTVAQFYFNYPNSDITLTSSWYETVSGSFNPPTDFVSPNQVFEFIANTGSTMGFVSGLTSWVVDGTNSKIIVGDGINTITFQAKFPVITNSLVTMDVQDKGIVQFQSSYVPTKLGVLNQGTGATPGSTVEYGDTTVTSTADTIIVANYCNLTFSGLTTGTRKYTPLSTIGVSRVFTPGGFTAALNGRLNFNGTTVAQVIPTGYLFNNLRINNTVATTTMAGNVSVDSVLSLNLATASLTVASGQTLTLISNATVANLVGALNINGSLTNNNPLTTVFAGSSPALLLFGANSNYNLSANLNSATNSGQIPSATWAASSTINITNVTMATVNDLVVGAPSGVGFGNIYFDAPSLGTAGYRLFGGFKSTGTGASGSPWIVTLQGNLTLGRNNNNAVDFSSTTSTEYRYINIGGNLLHYAGTYILSDHGGSASTFGIKMSVAGNATLDATYSTFAPAGGYSNPTYIIANVAGGKGTFEVGGNLATISGANTFTGASQTATISRISTTGTCNLNFTGTSVAQTASFNTPFFGGTGGIAMNVIGAAGVTLISDLTTLGTVNLTGGNFRIQAAKTLTLTGATASSVSSGFTFNVDGILRNSSTIAGVPVTTAGTLSVNNGGIYEHDINTGSVPTATWQTGVPGSTCFIRGITSNNAGPGGLGQSFYNFLWKCTGQTTNVDLTGNLGPHIFGYFAIDSTGLPASGFGLRLNANAPSIYTLTVDGNASVNIGNLALSYGSSTVTMSCTDFSVSNNSTVWLNQTSTGSGILKVGGNLTAASGTTITELGTGTANEIQFTKSGTQILTNVGSTFSNDISYTVNGSSTTQLATSSYITVNTGAKLSLLTGGILDINGNTVTVNGLINTGAPYLGTFKGSTSSNILLGGTAGANMGTLYFTSGSQLLNNLNFNRTGTSPAATLGTNLQINGACSLISGVLQINGNTLTLNGTYSSGASNAGSLTGSATSSVVVGSSATSVPLTFTYDASKVNNSLLSLTVNAAASLDNNTTSSSLYIVGGTSTTPGNITVTGSAIFTTHDSLTLQSNAGGTARVGPNNTITNYITGNVTIERYLESHRAWRLLTGPISTSQSINASWQEGNITTVPTSPAYTLSGFGTSITNTIATNPGTTGFDQAVTNNPSILYLNAAGTSWLVPTATNGTTATTGNVSAGSGTGQEGYMLFIRGDRSVIVKTPPFAAPTSTTLRTRGTLKMSTKIYSTATSGFKVVGNPYASEISLDQIFSNYSTKIGSTYYLWDPLLATGQGVGAFYTITKSGASYAATTHTTTTDIPGRVESGAAFVLNFSVGASILIIETDKTTSAPLVMRPFDQAIVDQSFRADLYSVNSDGSTDLDDGTLTLYDNQYSDSVNWLEDAKKIGNPAENLALERDGQLLAIEKRQPISVTDTIFLKITGMKQQQPYQFRFAAENLVQPGLIARLEDKYLNTSTPVSLTDTAKINFTVTSDAASQGGNRFRIVFQTAGAGPLPVTFTSVKASQQNNNDIAIQWNVTNQLNIKQYEVEKSTDGITFVKVNTTTALVTGSSSINYNWVDSKAVTGDNYYRIVSVSTNGTLSYSQVVRVKIGSNVALIEVYPNPVTAGIIGLQFTNMPKGVYNVRLHSTVGQEILNTQIEYNEGSSTEQIMLNKTLAKGIYQLEIIKPDNSKTSLNVIVQ